MDNKIVTLAITLTVAVIVIAAVLVPALDIANDETYATYTNIDRHYSSKVTDDVTGSLASGTYTINGATVSGLSNRAVIWSDTGVITMLNTSTCNITYVSGSTATTVGYVNGFSISIDYDTKTISITDITYSNSTTTPTSISWTYQDVCFYASATGDYSDLWITAAGSITISDPKDVYYAIKVSSNMFFFNGTEQINGTTTGATATITGTEIDGYPFEKVDFTTSSGSGIYATYNSTDSYGGYIVVPHKVSGQSEFGSNYTPIMWAILPIMIVSLIIVAVSIFRRE